MDKCTAHDDLVAEIRRLRYLLYFAVAVGLVRLPFEFVGALG